MFLKKKKTNPNNHEDLISQEPPKQSIGQKIRYFVGLISRIIKYTSWLLTALFILVLFLIFSGNKPYDLGIQVTPQAAEQFEKKIKNLVFKDKNQTLSLEASQEEITSYANLKADIPKLSNIQIAFENKNQIIFSAIMKNALGSYNLAFKTQGKIIVQEGKPRFILNSITLGKLPILLSSLKEWLENTLNENIKMPQADGFKILVEEIRTEKGKVHLLFKLATYE